MVTWRTFAEHLFYIICFIRVRGERLLGPKWFIFSLFLLFLLFLLLFHGACVPPKGKIKGLSRPRRVPPRTARTGTYRPVLARTAPYRENFARPAAGPKVLSENFARPAAGPKLLSEKIARPAASQKYLAKNRSACGRPKST